MAESYFSPDYFEARERFREFASKAGARLDSLGLTAKGPAGEDLTIDIATIGAEHPKEALFHSSGLHGIEGFAGSAIQLQFLRNPPKIPADAAVVIAHVLNPYGMAWLRRVNENNVDLNRNFRADQKYQGAPAMYAGLNSFLNPQTPPAPDLFYVRVVSLILRHGMSALKQAVVGGQYEYPEGLFFGGKRQEQGPRALLSFMEERLSATDRLIAIDVHTGIGKYAEDTLLVAEKDFTRIRDLFGERVTVAEPDRGPAYRIEGGLESCGLFTRAETTFVRQEFGTFSGPEVLRALREENRWHYHGAGSLDHAVKRKLRQTFCPDDDQWRQSVLNRGSHLLQQALRLMSQA